MTDLRVPRTDPLLPPGMTDRDVEPVPGDDSDGTCPECGSPISEDNECPDEECRVYQTREWWNEITRGEP